MAERTLRERLEALESENLGFHTTECSGAWREILAAARLALEHLEEVRVRNGGRHGRLDAGDIAVAMSDLDDSQPGGER